MDNWTSLIGSRAEHKQRQRTEITMMDNVTTLTSSSLVFSLENLSKNQLGHRLERAKRGGSQIREKVMIVEYRSQEVFEC